MVIKFQSNDLSMNLFIDNCCYSIVGQTKCIKNRAQEALWLVLKKKKD